MNLVNFCIKRPVTTTMFFAALMILGAFSGMRMSMDLMPDISYPTVNISTSYEGAGPEEIERLITIPIEKAVATISGITSISSSSQEGRSRVTLNFDWGMDLDEPVNDIRANLDRVRNRLPDGADVPSIFRYNPSAMPVMEIGISSDVVDEFTLLSFAEEDLSYLIQKVEGVAGAEVRGGRGREINVYLKQERLHSLGITASEVISAISKENVMEPAGNMEIGSGDYLLRTKGEFTTIDDIRNLPIIYRQGIPVYLRDVATIEDGGETIRRLVRIDGRPGVILSVQKQSGSNTVDVADQVYEALEEIKRQYTEINFRVLNDGSTYIRQSVAGVGDSAVSGAILAGIILFIFLHSIRATLMTAIVMPISILITLMIASLSGLTLNTISLGGLALGVGMLVDNSVVVLDNVFRKLQDPAIELKQAAAEGTAEMASALMASTMTTVCVFFPLIFISGQTGIIFKELAYMVIFSLFCSLLVALTLMPMLCSKYLSHQDEKKIMNNPVKGYFYKIQIGWEESYQRLLKKCLDHKGWLIILSVLAFLISLCLAPFIGTEMIQASDEGVISIRLTLPTGTRLEETNALSLQLEERIKAIVPELDNMEATVGGNNVSSASFTLRLVDINQRERSTETIVEQLQEEIKFPGTRVRIYARNSMRMLYSGSSDNNAIIVDVRGYNQVQAREIASLIAKGIGAIPGITNVSISQEERQPELGITIDRQRAADLGVSVSAIAAAIQIGVKGKVATIFRQDGEEIDVRVNLQPSDRESWQDLGRIMVSGSNGRNVPLSSLVSIIQSESPVAIVRKDQERNIAVQAGLSGRDLAGAMEDIQAVVNQIKLPRGITVTYGGDYEKQQKSFAELAFALVLALILVYMVMAAQFESYLDPLIIMTLVPFSLTGVLVTLILTNTYFSDQVYIGLIFLGGVVVNNAIVLVSYIRMMLDKGWELETAIVKGSASRLRPILITTITTILGLIPLALGLDEGSRTQAPMARTIIGGLVSSTVVSLILIPTIMFVVEEALKRFKFSFKKKKSRKGWQTFVCLLLVLGMLGLFSQEGIAANDGEVRKISLPEAIELALKNSEAGKIIEAKRDQAAAAYQQQLSDNRWQLQTELETSAVSGDEAETVLELEASKSQPLSKLWGKNSLAHQVALANWRISQYSLETQEQGLIMEVIELFQKELLAVTNLEIATANYQWSQRFYDEVATRSELGLTTIIDETGAEAQLATDMAGLNRARNQYRVAKLKFRQLLGLASESELELVPPEQQKLEVDLAVLTETAKEKRWDLKQARAENLRAEYLVKLARLAAKMGISLDWEFERENYEVNLGIGNENSNGSSGEWQLKGTALGFKSSNKTDINQKYPENGRAILKFTWKLWDGKLRQERIKEAEAVAVQALKNLELSDKKVDLEVEEAYYNYLNQLDTVLSSELQLKYNRIKLEALEAKLQLGLVSVTEVLEAKLLLNQAELSFNEAKSDLHLREMGLLKVSGVLNWETPKYSELFRSSLN